MHGPTDFIYLATPYTSYTSGIYRAAEVAYGAVARMMRAGYRVFSPIASFHYLTVEYAVDRHVADDADALHSFWMNKDRPFMQHAAALVVLRAAGWDKSRGIAEEIEFFEAAKKPIYFLDVGDLNAPVELIPREAA